ncbi:acyl-CoA dehydrogenase family protein [Advenella kashmirensis]|nr:acyl-CoA dehydrogenase family protein [Advenella kashmirensis]
MLATLNAAESLQNQPDTHSLPDPAQLVAPDCHGMNFYDADPAFKALLKLRLPADTLTFLDPHLSRLGEIAGNELDTYASIADKERNKPYLRTRNRFGVNEDWVEYHPAYRSMERIAYIDFGIHAMSRTEGVLGWPQRYAPLAKYAFQYLFVQSEFGLMCPISVTDSSTYLVERYGNEDVKQRFLPGMTSTDPATLLKGSQFMTERTGGSDVSASRLKAVKKGDAWELYGDKWFCSAVDADVALLIARPEGASDGNEGLALFAMPRRLDDGSRNKYRIARLKDKLGTRSMPSGEIIFEGAIAYLVGRADRGLKQMLDQVNLSRLSHGVRAAAMMRRCLNESMVVANHRVAFRKRLIDMPLQRRQLMKLMLPTEQALSVFMHAAEAMQKADSGDRQAALVQRILTPLLKFRACRDNIQVATGAMEVRGGNGYIEDFVNERLVRDAHIGVLWEGTSNINAIDVVQRAVAKQQAHRALAASLVTWLDDSPGIPAAFRQLLLTQLEQISTEIEACASDPDLVTECRTLSSQLYHCAAAILMAGEGARTGADNGDARRLLLSRQVLRHRLGEKQLKRQNEVQVEALLLDPAPVALETAIALLS